MVYSGLEPVVYSGLGLEPVVYSEVVLKVADSGQISVFLVADMLTKVSNKRLAVAARLPQ